MKKLGDVPVGVPGREIGAFLPKGGGPTGESIARALRVSPVDIKGTPVLIDKLDGIPNFPGEGEERDGEGESTPRRLGSRTVCRKESVCNGVRFTLGSVGGGVKVIEGGRGVDFGTNGGADALSIGVL